MGISLTLIRQQDIFGYKIHLNFNNNGPAYNSIVGGIVSMLLKIMIFGFTTYKVQRMLSHKDDNIQAVT